MAASILLPDGTPATIHHGVWHCDDPEAIPVLHYFTRRVPPNTHGIPDRIIARGITKLITGARFIEDGYQPEPDRPGEVS